MSDLESIIETFDFLAVWDERYRFLEELGGELGYLLPEQKIDPNIVHGCASNVWVIGYPGEAGDGHIFQPHFGSSHDGDPGLLLPTAGNDYTVRHPT